MEIEPNIPMKTQLADLGQLRDVRTNSNLKEVDINYLLKKTPL
jgi:hypothetical protein